MRKKINALSSITIISIFAILLASCQITMPTMTTNPAAIQITVSIPPQAYFVRRIAGDLAAVNVMVGPGEEPHTYEPTPEQMKELTHSKIFFSIGVEYEDTWLPRFEEINPELWVVDSSAGITRIEMIAIDPHDDAETGSDHNHESGFDPHVWLSPANGKIIADNILAALSEIDPDNIAIYQANAESLLTDIDQLDSAIQSTFAGVEQRTFMVFHPAWGYFAHEYGLEQIAVQVEGQDPSASELAELVKTARERNIKVVFAQPSFSTFDAETIAREIGGEVVLVDPLAEDWLANLQIVTDAFAAALQP